MIEASQLRDLDALRAVAVAGALAGLIGLEREIAHKPAGLRTHILVGAGAALFMELGDFLIAHFAAPPGPTVVSVDPLRMLQAIVVGISFLGAGTIVQSTDERVEGLTTAASILLTAAVGIAVALQHSALAAALAVSIAFVLFALGRLEHWLGLHSDPPRDPAQSSTRPPARRRRLPPGSS